MKNLSSHNMIAHRLVANIIEDQLNPEGLENASSEFGRSLVAAGVGGSDMHKCIAELWKIHKQCVTK